MCDTIRVSRGCKKEKRGARNETTVWQEVACASECVSLLLISKEDFVLLCSPGGRERSFRPSLVSL